MQNKGEGQHPPQILIQIKLHLSSVVTQISTASYASATLSFFRGPIFFYGELRFEEGEGMVEKNQTLGQQGYFDDLVQNRTVSSASKKVVNF